MATGGNSSCKCDQPKPYQTMQSAPYLFYDKKGAEGPSYPRQPVMAAAPPVMPEGTTTLHFALGNMKLADIEQLLKQNPDAINEKGFNGQSPLHKAVLGSDIMVIDLLLRFKADPNAQNDFQETPFHFACKRGNPMIMNLLRQNKADINAVDKAGKGAIHHATHGGSVYSLHFLTEVCGMNTHVRDVNLSTPLHVVCAHGHVEALNYLLRKDRSDLFAQNAHGNNAMHIAANSGHGWTCWRLIDEGGLQLLHEENREGNTPLDLARKKQNDSKYQETINLLTYYTVAHKKTGRGAGPVLGWYFHALLPILAYPIIVYLSNQTSRPGVFSAAGLIVLILILLQHSHRINHISRWPNPMYFGMFLGGMLHSMTCFYVNVVPVIYGEHSLMIQFMVLMNIFLAYVYYLLLTRDPGIARESAPKPGSLWPYSMADVCDGTLRLESFCMVCELIPPRLTHHCKLCLNCYLNTDHHCLFLYRCIARNNHRLFIGFIALVVMAILMFVYSMIQYFQVLYPEYEHTKDMIVDILSDRPWEWTLFLANVVSIFWGCNLLKFQLNVASKAQTTVYQPNEGKTSLNLKQRLCNVVYFLSGRGYFASDATFTA